MIKFNPFKRKESPKEQVLSLDNVELKAGIFHQIFTTGNNKWEDFDYWQKAQYSYELNSICHAMINEIAQAVSTTPLKLFKGDVQVDTHPILDLLARPNPTNSKESFFFALTAFLHIAGNSYIEALRPNSLSPNTEHGMSGDVSLGGGTPLELWNHVPGNIIFNTVDGNLVNYQQKLNNKVIRTFPVEFNKTNIYHYKRFSPYSTIDGLTDLNSVAWQVDIINDVFESTRRFINSDGNIGGWLTATDSHDIDVETAKFIQQQFKDSYTGKVNSGKIPIFLGVEFTPSGASVKDMQYLEAINAAARHIALAFGVPPVLLGIQGDSTYNNQKEARLAFYENKIIPLSNYILGELNHWLVPMFGDNNLRLQWDWDQVPALAIKRQMLWDTVGEADFLTVNEKREAVGFERIEGGDSLTGVTAPDQNTGHEDEDDDDDE